MITDSSASRDPTAETSSDTFRIFTGSALTCNPGLAAAAGAGVAGVAASAVFAASGLGASDFWAATAVASLLEPHPARSTAVTSAVRIVTLRMVGVCTTSSRIRVGSLA